MDVKKGRLYSLCQYKPKNFPGNSYKNKHCSLTKHKAEYFLVMRRIDNLNSLCVPIVRECHSHQVELILNGNTYYANYLFFLTVPNVLLEETNAYLHNSYQLIDQIYKKSKAHHKVVAKRLHSKRIKERKKQKEIRRDNQYLREMAYEKSSVFPSDRPSSTVTWRMAHPAQGGRTSPR